MWPFTPFGGYRQEGNYRVTLEDEAPSGAIERPLFWLGSLFMGGQSGQDPNAERAPFW